MYLFVPGFLTENAADVSTRRPDAFGQNVGNIFCHNGGKKKLFNKVRLIELQLYTNWMKLLN